MALNGIIGIIALICAIWVIYDVVANRKRMVGLVKVLWIVAALLFSIVTAIIYYFIYKK